MCYNANDELHHHFLRRGESMAKQATEKKKRSAIGRPLIDTERRTHVGQIIRKYRRAAGMDQATLAAKLGYTKTAIGNWELGLSRPDVDNVPKLCKELNIPVTELLGMDQEAALPLEDKSLLEMYHGLDKFNRHTIRQIMDRLLFQQDSKEKERLRHSYMSLCLYEEAAAAGIGAPMQDYVENKTVYVLGKNVPHGTNGIIHVNGQSMEPTFSDGSYVYIDSTAEVQPGQIGIFIVNGESFIKEYQPDGLYSHNTRYKPITITEGSDIRCCGKVTGLVVQGDIATGALAEKIEAVFEEN